MTAVASGTAVAGTASEVATPGPGSKRVWRRGQDAKPEWAIDARGWGEVKRGPAVALGWLELATGSPPGRPEDRASASIRWSLEVSGPSCGQIEAAENNIAAQHGAWPIGGTQ